MNGVMQKPATYEWWIYTGGWSSSLTAAGTSTTQNIQIAADARFQIQFITLSVRQTGSTGTIVLTWAGLVQITYTALGRTIANQDIPAHAILLAGQQPYYLKPFREIPSNSTIQVTYTTNVATDTQCAIAFHGNKVYYQ